MAVYNDPIIQTIFDNIDASDGGAITTFFHGDPILVAKSDLPVLIGSKDTTEIGDFSNAEDYHKMNIVLTLVVDIRDYMGETGDYYTHVAFQKLYDMIEGRDENTFALKTTSILDILRKNSNLGNNANIDLQTPTTVDYGLTIGKRGENSWSWEANISFSVYFPQTRG